MKKIILFSIFLLIGCKSENIDLIGNYKTHKSSYTQKWINYLSNRCNVLGIEMNLKKDSTFLINTCSYSGTGNWNVKNDSLILKYTSKKIFIDSINSFKKVELGNDLGESYLIKDNYLFQEIESENSICTIKLIKN